MALLLKRVFFVELSVSHSDSFILQNMSVSLSTTMLGLAPGAVGGKRSGPFLSEQVISAGIFPNDSFFLYQVALTVLLDIPLI